MDATGAFVGFQDLPGRSWGAIDVKVEGGQYGLYLPSSVAPVVVGATLRHQTVAAISSRSIAPVTLVGFDIEKSTGPVLVTQEIGGVPASGTLSLVDRTIRLATPGAALDNSAERNLYLRDVWVHNASSVVRSGTHGAVGAAGPPYSQSRKGLNSKVRQEVAARLCIRLFGSSHSGASLMAA